VLNADRGAMSVWTASAHSAMTTMTETICHGQTQDLIPRRVPAAVPVVIVAVAIAVTA
jgi:hypothetical protein